MSRTLLLATIGLVAACGRTEKAPAPKPAAAAETLLAHLPADTEAVVAGSLTELNRWPLWRRAVGVVAYDLPGIAEQIVTTCKLDPWSVIDNAALAFTADATSAVLAAETTIDRARLHACMTAVGSGAALTVEDGPIAKYKNLDATELAAWLGDRVFLTVPQRTDELDVLQPLLEVRPAPKDLQPLLARADRSATVWGVALANGNGEVARVLATVPLTNRPLGIHVAIRRGVGLRAHAALVFPDAAGATEASKLFQSLLDNPPPWLAPWRDDLAVEVRGQEARLELVLDADRARKLDDALIALLPVPPAQPPGTPAP
jgi:hypothetical protein